MKIWMVTWSYWPGPQGGAERQCRLLVSNFPEGSVECSVITGWLSWRWKRKEKDGFAIIRRFSLLAPLALAAEKAAIFFIARLCSGKGKGNDLEQKIVFWLRLPFVWLARFFFMVEFSLWSYRNKETVDIIHVHETGWLGAFTIYLAKKLGKPVLCKEATYPAFPVLGWDVPFRRFLKRYQRNAHIIALNDAVKEDLMHKGVAEKRISLIPNAVIYPSIGAKPGESNTVLYVGNFSQGAYLKAFDVLFEAWASVAKDLPNITLIMLGGGNTEYWKKVAKSLECDQSVRFLGFCQNTSPYFRDAGLFVLPSRVEGMSNALLEAMSWGLPAVVSDIPGNLAVVSDGENGKVVPAGDSNALAETIVQLMNSPQLRGTMGVKGRETVAKEFKVEIVLNKLVHLYNTLVKRDISA